MKQLTTQEIKFQCLIAARDSYPVGSEPKNILTIANKYYKFVTKPDKKPKTKIGYKHE